MVMSKKKGETFDVIVGELGECVCVCVHVIVYENGVSLASFYYKYENIVVGCFFLRLYA